jgi:hypothetical protein
MAGKFTVVKEAILIPLMSRSIIKKIADFSPSAARRSSQQDSPGSALLKGSGTVLRPICSNKKLHRGKEQDRKTSSLKLNFVSFYASFNMGLKQLATNISLE